MDSQATLIFKTSPRLFTLTVALLLSLIYFNPVEAKSANKKKSSKKQTPASLWQVYKNLTSGKIIDLTHTFKPGIPKWRGYPDQSIRNLYRYEKHGFRADQYTLVGQWGTHVDAPSHFHKGLRSLDDIPVKEMIAPLVVINLSKQVEEDPNTRVSVKHIIAWEKKYGKIPERSFIAFRSDWSKRWPVEYRIENRDEKKVMRFPGWSLEALKFLILERNILAIGHETTDTDAGFEVSIDRYPAQAYIHGQDRYQVELMANLDQVPEYGSIIVVSFPKPENGSGFPARVFAIVP